MVKTPSRQWGLAGQAISGTTASVDVPGDAVLAATITAANTLGRWARARQSHCRLLLPDA